MKTFFHISRYFLENREKAISNIPKVLNIIRGKLYDLGIKQKQDKLKIRKTKNLSPLFQKQLESIIAERAHFIEYLLMLRSQLVYVLLEINKPLEGLSNTRHTLRRPKNYNVKPRMLDIYKFHKELIDKKLIDNMNLGSLLLCDELSKYNYAKYNTGFSFERKNKDNYNYIVFKVPVNKGILNISYDTLKVEIKDFSKNIKNVCKILDVLVKLIVPDVVDPEVQIFYNNLFNTVDFPFMFYAKYKDKNLGGNIIHIQII